MITAFTSGDVGRATQIHHQLLVVFEGMFRTQGVILAKAALAMLGLPGGPVRLPLVNATVEQVALLRDDLVAGGVPIP
jgi:4-hydroxy-tetrahydrodipicolinate synthase